MIAAGNATAKWEVQMRKGCVELAVLAILGDGRLYGLQILRRLEYFSGLTVSEGTIYPLLSRLAAGGLVESEWQDTPYGHPRRYYTLTAEGRSRAVEMSKSWMRLAGNISQLVGRMEAPPSEPQA